MYPSSQLKLIAVFNSFHLELYEAAQEKIIFDLKMQLTFTEHKRDDTT